MKNFEYDRHEPRDFTGKTKVNPVREDFNDDRSVKIGFKSYLQQIKIEEASIIEDPVSVAPAFVYEELDEELEEVLLEEFLEWSEGILPEEMDDADLQIFAYEIAPKEIDSSVVLRFVRNHIKED